MHPTSWLQDNFLNLWQLAVLLNHYASDLSTKSPLHISVQLPAIIQKVWSYSRRAYLHNTKDIAHIKKITLQNHSITLVRRDPWWLLVQCSGHSRLLMAMSSSDLSISKEWHVYNLPEQPVLVLYHSHGEKRFPWISSEIPMFQLEAVDSHPNTTHLKKEPGCFVSKPSHKSLKTIHQDPPRKTNKQHILSFPHIYVPSYCMF